MKKIILFLLMLVGITAYGQNNFKYIINANGGLYVPEGELDIGTVPITTTGTQINLLNTATGRTGTGNLVYSDSPTFTGTVTGGNIDVVGGIQQKGIYNVINYGAISDDGNCDADEINAAISAAVAASEVSDVNSVPICPTVVIPDGVWYVTDTLWLQSNITIEVGRNAYIYVPNAYNSVIWYWRGGESEELVRCRLSGGIYYQTGLGNTYNGIKIVSEEFDEYMMFCDFRDMYFHYPDTAISLGVWGTAPNYGWINGNSFKDITIWRPVVGVAVYEPSDGMLTGNIWQNVQIQCHTMTTHGFYNMRTYKNEFIGCRVWDLSSGQIGMDLKGYYNTVIGGSLGAFGTYFTENGTGNMVFNYMSGSTSGHIMLDYQGKITWHNENTSITHGTNILEVDATYGYGVTEGTPIYYDIRNTGNIGPVSGFPATSQSGAVRYTGSSAVDITANPQIADAYKDGTTMIIIGTSDINTLKLDDGDGLQLKGGASITLGVGDVIQLIYSKDADLWIELSRSDN